MYKCLSTGAIGVKADLEESIQLAKNAGFGGLDVNARAIHSLIQEKGADFVKGLFATAGLKMGSWGLGMPWNGPEEDYRDGLEALPAIAKSAASVGATRVSQWIPPATKDMRFRESFRWHVSRLKPIAEILKAHGCRLGLEFIGPRTLRDAGEYGFIYTQAGMLALTEAIGTGNVGLLLDAWHWYTGLGTESDLRSLTNDDVVLVHVNDAPRGVDIADQVDNVRALPAETGVIDIGTFLRVLNDLGYDGPVTPEPFSQRIRELPLDQAVSETAQSLAKAWELAGL